jgi:hypothetical protein
VLTGFEIDGQIKFFGLLDRNVAGLFALQDFVGELRRWTSDGTYAAAIISHREWAYGSTCGWS